MTKWSWKFWRVVTWAKPRECSSATSAIASSWGPVEHALRDLHPLHVVLGLALAVGAVEEAELPPGLGADLAALELPEHLDELVEISRSEKGARSRAPGAGWLGMVRPF